MFISPTEPKAIRELGVTSPMPEEYGVDIMWSSKLGTIGIQRKVFASDFLASVQDGRLNREFMMMKQLDIAILLLEGKGQWTTEGELYGAYGGEHRAHRWTRSQHRNYLTSVQMRGVQVHTSDSITDTLDFVTALRVWSDKGDHNGLDRNPGAKGDLYGTVRSSDYVKWLYQDLPGVGPTQAAMIFNKLGIIFGLKVTEEDLMTVPGIGKGRARKIMEVFNVGN